jgi:hypothetical protein
MLRFPPGSVRDILVRPSQPAHTASIRIHPHQSFLNRSSLRSPYYRAYDIDCTPMNWFFRMSAWVWKWMMEGWDEKLEPFTTMNVFLPSLVLGSTAAILVMLSYGGGWVHSQWIECVLSTVILGCLYFAEAPRKKRLLAHIVSLVLLLGFLHLAHHVVNVRRCFTTQTIESGNITKDVTRCFSFEVTPLQPLTYSPSNDTYTKEQYDTKLEQEIQAFRMSERHRYLIPIAQRVDFWDHSLRICMGLLREGEDDVGKSEEYISLFILPHPPHHHPSVNPMLIGGRIAAALLSTILLQSTYLQSTITTVPTSILQFYIYHLYCRHHYRFHTTYKHTHLYCCRSPYFSSCYSHLHLHQQSLSTNVHKHSRTQLLTRSRRPSDVHSRTNICNAKHTPLPVRLTAMRLGIIAAAAVINGTYISSLNSRL